VSPLQISNALYIKIKEESCLLDPSSGSLVLFCSYCFLCFVRVFWLVVSVFVSVGFFIRLDIITVFSFCELISVPQQLGGLLSVGSNTRYSIITETKICVTILTGSLTKHHHMSFQCILSSLHSTKLRVARVHK
jgi:hypothetical protein